MTEPDSGQTRDQTLDRFFEHYYSHRPVNATFTGIHEYDASLPDWSPEGLDQTVAEMADIRGQLSACGDARTGTPKKTTIESVDRAMADAFLEIQIAESRGRHFQRGNPALHTGEAIFSVISLMLRDFAPASDRVKPIEKRLSVLPEFLNQAERTIGDNPVPASWTERAVGECEGAIHLLDAGLRKWCDEHNVGSDIRGRLEREARNARSAFAEFGSWCESRPSADPQYSGAGPEFYDLLLSRGHWCSRSREDLLTEALELFDEAEDILAKAANAADAAGWPGVSERLSDKHPSPGEYLTTFESTWSACRRTAEGRDLVSWPEFPIAYVQIPDWARTAAPFLYFLHYRSPAPFDRAGIHEYLVPAIDVDGDEGEFTESLRAVNDSTVKLNHVVHHGALGHHVQNYYAIRSESRIGQVAAVDCASRIGMFCGGTVAEGWACYATDLMGEVGFLTELELVAEQHSRMRQLARAIVDIQLHQNSWSENDARSFYRERVGMNATAARKEVTRNSMFPGASIMYWLGTQGIHDLRNTISRIEGSDFSLRSFHDRFLSYGSIPVFLITQLMTEGRTT